MKFRGYKIFTALLLVFILAATPVTLFASVWDDVPGRAFKAQLVEIFGEMRADWVVEDLELLREMEILGNEDFYALFAMGANDALEEHLTPEQLEAFWVMDYSDRFWLVHDELIGPLLWDSWDWDDNWDDWEWTPAFTRIWFDVGGALRRQLVDLVGDLYAMWITADLEWQRDIVGEAIFFEILALNLTDFFEEHMTDDEIEAMLANDDKYYIYQGLWGLFREVYFPHLEDWDQWDQWDDWDDWEWTPDLSPFWQYEGLAFKTQLIEILGESQAYWVADDLEWWLEIGRLTEDTLAEIFALDIMAALEEQFTADEMEIFFEMDYGPRRWDIWDFVLEPMILAGWAHIADITRDDLAAALEVVAGEYLTYHNFDITPLLDAAEMDTDTLVDILYVLLGMDEGSMMMWMAMAHGEEWLYYYVDDILRSLYLDSEGAVTGLRALESFALILTLFDSDDFFRFFSLTVFEDVMDALGYDAFEEAFFAGSNMANVLRTYGTDLMEILDFWLYDALSELFADGQWPEGLRVLDELLSGLLTDSMDALRIFYEEGPPIRINWSTDWADWSAEQPIDFWNFLGNWEYLILNEENLEERISLDITVGTEVAIDFLAIYDAHLNLFYANRADSYATVVIEFTHVIDGWTEHIFEVPPGGSVTMQITADELYTRTNMVWVMIVNLDGGGVYGEFALRKTHQPLN